MKEFKNGMTVKDLKDIIKDWNEIDEYTGNACEVWIETGKNTSSPVTAIYLLNRREFNNKIYADFLLESDAFSRRE